MTSRGTIVNPSCRGACDPALSELDYVLRNFEANFANWRGKRIVLHGVRAYAQAIVETFDGTFHFEAIAAQAEDAHVCSLAKPFWTNEQLIAAKPDLVIMTERVRHAEAVYQEIGAACREAGIPLFDMYGLDWLALRDEIDGQFANTLERWLDIVGPYDAVSFEVPDCLTTAKPGQEGTSLACKPAMRKFVDHLVHLGKRVLFIGRGPYTAQEQVAALEASGLMPNAEKGPETFFMRAGEDGTWRTVRAAYPAERILHVGYGIPKECVLPRYYGVHTYRLTNGIVMDDEEMGLEALVRESLDPERLRARLESAIDEADVVSFDVFDTLLMRTTLIPGDVFDIVEQRAVERGLQAAGFAQARRDAQTAQNYTATAIYDELKQKLGCSDAESKTLYELELEVEREVLLPREPLYALFRQALAQGKRVFLVSDMYHAGETLVRLLEENGIAGYEKLLVSSDCRQLKSQGLFDALTTLGVPASRIVHIGNNINDDMKQAKRAGLQAVLVPSPLALALAQGANRTITEHISLQERLDMGKAIAARFADPFETRAVPVLAGPRQGIANPLVRKTCTWTMDAAFAEKGALHVATCDNRIPHELRQGLLAWYPFLSGSRALFIGSDREALAPLIEKHFETVDFELAPGAHYDLVVVLDVLDSKAAFQKFAHTFADALAPDGVLLVGFRNRFGLKYLCGAIDNVVEHPFDALADANAPGVFGLHEMQHLVEHAGLTANRTYYALPDASFVQAVYTDDYIPPAGIHDRVMPFDACASPLVAAEHNLYPAVVEEGMLPFVANYYLVECRKPDAAIPTRQVAHVALSLDRGKEHSFITTLFTDGTALKATAYPEGRTSLEALYDNCCALRARGIATVDAQLASDGLHMPLVRELSMLEYLDSLLPDSPDAFVSAFEQLYDDVLKSSDTVEIAGDEALSTWGVQAHDLGPLLETGFIDMVPYNAFWEDGTIRYFDQEFTVKQCPAKYVLFRALRYTWIHLPHAEQTIPPDDVKKRFGLERLWNNFMRHEERFVDENRNRKRYRDIFEWARLDVNGIAARRNALASSTGGISDKPYGTGLLMGVFDLFHVGHLRLIKRAKERCRFLRVAVLADEVVQRFKGITPTIPLAQRMEILAAIDGVDEVVAIEDDPSRLAEWHRRPFDCFFSGDDYADNEYWKWERQELEKLGATIEFFTYTEEQSSTNIRGKLAKHSEEKTS